MGLILKGEDDEKLKNFINNEDHENNEEEDEDDKRETNEGRFRTTMVYKASLNPDGAEINLERQILLSKMKTIVTSESLMLMEGMKDKYLENLQELNQEQVQLNIERETRRLTLQSNMGNVEEQPNRITTIMEQNEIDLAKLKDSIAIATKRGIPLNKIMKKEKMLEIATNNMAKLNDVEIDIIAEEVILNQCPNFKTGLKHKNFILLATMAFCSTCFNYFMNATWKQFAKTRLEDTSDSALSMILTAAGIFEAVSGLITGTLMLYIPFKLLYFYQLTLQLLTTATIYYFAKDYISITIYVSLSMFFLGSDKTIYPTITQKIFGPVAGPKLYPMVYVFFSLSSFFQFISYSYIKLDFQVLFIVFFVMTLIALFGLFLLDSEPDWSKYYDVEAVRTATLDVNLEKKQKNNLENEKERNYSNVQTPSPKKSYTGPPKHLPKFPLTGGFDTPSQTGTLPLTKIGMNEDKDSDDNQPLN